MRSPRGSSALCLPQAVALHVFAVTILLIFLGSSKRISNPTPDALFDQVPLPMLSALSGPLGVKTVDFSNKAAHFLSSMVRRRKPFLLGNASAQSWAAQDWDLDTLARGEGGPLLLSGVLSVPRDAQGGGVFYTHQAGGGLIRHTPSPGAGAGKCTVASALALVEEPSVLAELPLSQMLAEARAGGGGGGPLYFHSQDFAAMQLQGDATWRDLLVEEEDSNSTTQPAPLLHLLSAGGRLQARYSEYHTVWAQLKGTARLLLLPPAQESGGPDDGGFFARPAGAASHLFPSVHACAPQWSLDLHADCASSTGALQGLRVVEVGPGQTLYIPPFWLLQAEARSLTVALAVQSVSREQRLLAPAFHMGLPFDAQLTLTPQQKLVSAQVFLVHLLSRVRGVRSVRQHARQQLARFDTLYPQGSPLLLKLKGDGEGAFHCLRGEQHAEEHTAIVRGLSPQRVKAAAAFVAARLNHPFFADASAAAAEASSKAQNGASSGTGSGGGAGAGGRVGSGTLGARWVWLDGYMEQVARWAAGDPERAGLFLSECLHMDVVLEVEDEEEGPAHIQMAPHDD
ncbi:hypothetical protein B484DRAFT_441579 [Ochromonadaceae sp. CCMP2298]|nr:hypothetical protein B484DRAFT_441579 [Ochromonadaceae sp. CCMP2298]